MNQPPDPGQPNQPPTGDASNNVPPIISAPEPPHFEESRPYGQPGATSYPAEYNPAGSYPPPGYPPQQPPSGYPPQQPPSGYPPQQLPPGYPPQQFPVGYPPDYNQLGNYPPPMGYSTQPFPAGYLPGYNQLASYPPPGYPPQQPPTGHPPQPFPLGSPPEQPGQWVGYPPQAEMPRRRNIGWIIGGISVVVVIAIITVTLIATHGFRQEPPSSWLARYSPNTSTVTYVYFIHWTNQDGQLKGSMDDSSSSGQSISYTLDGTYDYQNHTVILHFHENSVTATITGNIDNNSMTLHSPSTSNTSTAANNDLIFHSASQQDYNNAIRNFKSTSY